MNKIALLALAPVALSATGCQMARSLVLPRPEHPWGSVSVSGGTPTPAGFFKGHVLAVAPDGNAASGRCFAKVGIVEWAWTAKKGFRFGTRKLPSGSQFDDPKAPKARLTAWDKANGWGAAYPGKPFGTKTALYAFATGMSKDGSVVVGHYGSEKVAGRFGEFQGQMIGDHDVEVWHPPLRVDEEQGILRPLGPCGDGQERRAEGRDLQRLVGGVERREGGCHPGRESLRRAPPLNPPPIDLVATKGKFARG